MKPSAEDIGRAKAAASAAGKSAFAVSFDAHEAEFIVRDLTCEEFADWMDLAPSSKVNATSFLLSKSLLWPSIAEARAVMPAAAEEIAALVLEHAAATGDKPHVEPATPQALAAAGAPVDAMSGTPSVVLRMPAYNVTAVLRRPSVEAYDAARDGQDNAKASGVGRYAVAFSLARDVVVWSNEPLEVMLDRAPGVVLDIQHEALRLGGAGARRSVKSL